MTDTERTCDFESSSLYSEPIRNAPIVAGEAVSSDLMGMSFCGHGLAKLWYASTLDYNT